MLDTSNIPFHWDRRTVLVTGIGGFVGNALARTLISVGATVVGILRDAAGYRLLRAFDIEDRVEIVHGSITEPGLVARCLNEYDVDTVFHLAAQALVGVANRSPESTFESNILGTWRVLEAARLTKCVERVVVASSDKAYGIQHVLPYREDTPLNGLFPYDASKACTDILARSYAFSFDLPVAVTRCANIYGPGDLNWSRLIPGTIHAALVGTDPIVRSDGTPERDYIHVDDAVSAYMLLAEHLPTRAGEAFNFGTGHGVSALRVVQTILDAVENPGLRPRILGQARGEIDRQCLDSRKARELLGWTPTLTLEEGIRHSLGWYAEYLNPMRAELEASAGVV